jgi:hypothetical protein
LSRAAADAWFDQHKDPIRERIQSRREALQSIRYPQVLLTHTDAAIPADGGGTIPDALDRKTTDNDDGWQKLNLTIGGPWKAALAVDNYGSSAGQGYQIRLYVREAGKLYVKVPLQVGPETHRTHDWMEV